MRRKMKQCTIYTKEFGYVELDVEWIDHTEFYVESGSICALVHDVCDVELADEQLDMIQEKYQTEIHLRCIS